LDGISVIKENGMQIDNNIEDIDDNTFIMWKSELKKELPSFWEVMI
jgi:hypothetical protein